MNPASTHSKPHFLRRNAALVLVVAVSALLRLLFYFDIRDNPFFESPVIDARFYVDLARSWAAGEGTGEAPFMMPPLFPLLLAWLIRWFDAGWALLHAVQLGLGTCSAALTFLIGRQVASTRVGLIAGLLVASSQALLFVEADLLATPLAVLLNLATLYLQLRSERSPRPLWWTVLAALVFGLAVLARPSVLVTLPLFGFWLWRSRVASKRRETPQAGPRMHSRTLTWIPGLAFAVMWLLPVLPVTLHNYRSGREFVPISANGGINFYIGNNRDMWQTSRLRPGPEWRRMNDLPLRHDGILTPAGRDRWFYQEGLRFWQRQPLQAVQQTISKAALLLHNHEVMRDFDFYYFKRHFSRLLSLPWWDFALLWSLGLTGMLFGRPHPAGRRLLLGFFVVYACGIVFFFVTARYRAPLLPILSIFAGLGLAHLADLVQRRRWRRLLVALWVASAANVASRIDFWQVDRVNEVEAEYRIATAVEKKGRHAEALRLFDAVSQKDPDHKLAAGRAALAAQNLGRVQEAFERYRNLVDRHPDYVEAIVNLATLCWQAGSVDLAESYYRQAQEVDPVYAPGFGYYGLFLLEQDRPRPAISAMRRGLDLDPAWTVLRLELARAYLRVRESAAALREIENVARVMPPSDSIEWIRGDALQQLGRSIEAEQAWRRGLRLNPRNQALLERLQGTTP